MIAIRGATTIIKDNEDNIKSSSIELIKTILDANCLKEKDLISITFSCTSDIKSTYPGKYIREYFKFDKVAIMHFNEMIVENSLEKCIRVMLLVNREFSDNIKFVYLNKAVELRKDLYNDEVR